MGPSVTRVLVPIDGEEASLAAVDYAVAIADRYDAAVHAVYVLDEATVRDIETERIDTDAVADRVSSVVEGVRDTGQAVGVPVSTASVYGFSTRRKRRHPGSAILDTAEDVGADFLVVPREQDDGRASGILSKAGEYVLQYASQPVLAV